MPVTICSDETMALIGLSLFIASVSFICYKHPPFSWPLLQWLRRPSPQAVAQSEAPTTTNNDSKAKPLEELPCIESEPVSGSKQEIGTVKEAMDRKAMPPPPLVRKSASTPSPPAPRAAFITRPIIPSFTLDGKLDASPSAPSFPALNSAQRASGGARGPPQDGQQTLGLMPPPGRSILPNRTPNSSSLAPPPSHNSIPTKPREKVLLTPGHSPLDWARLASSPNVNLRGVPPSTPYLRVPPSLLKQFTGRKGKDAWTVLGGKVYNITPYLPYHPGGEPELMKCAGRDGSKLFGEVHPWVNWEGMLEGALIGIAVDEGDVKAQGLLDEMD